MRYFQEVDTLLGNYFFRFQEALCEHNNEIYRSDKAYPVLTAPIEQWLKEEDHSFESIGICLPELEKEREYLQSLIQNRDIGSNPLSVYRIKKRTLFTESLESTLRYLLAALTGGIWIIRSLR